MTTELRQRLNFDLPELPVADPREELHATIESIGHETGFAARSPTRPSSSSHAPASAVRTRRRRARAKTGRTFPFSTKLRETSYDMICGLSEHFTAGEGRPVSLAEVIERSLAALAAQTPGFESASKKLD